MLICGDDGFDIALLRNLLSGRGYEVLIAATSSAAAEMLDQTSPPHILMLEISRDCIELCRKLRSEPRDFYAYILMTAAGGDKALEELALHAGADEILPMAFDEAGVLARLSVARRIVDHQDAQVVAREELREQATKDPLTGLFNRTAFLDSFHRELDRAGRSLSYTGLLLIDLDHFKRVNDTYGHFAGDEVLREVARRLKQAVRSYDFIGRYGGEEFCVVLSNCTEGDLRGRADAIRLAIWGTPILLASGAVKVSTSIGATVIFANNRSMMETIAIADGALYHAKESGRNCTVCCSRPLLGESTKRPCSLCAAKCSKKCPVVVQSIKVPSARASLRHHLPMLRQL